MDGPEVADDPLARLPVHTVAFHDDGPEDLLASFAARAGTASGGRASTGQTRAPPRSVVPTIIPPARIMGTTDTSAMPPTDHRVAPTATLAATGRHGALRAHCGHGEHGPRGGRGAQGGDCRIAWRGEPRHDTAPPISSTSATQNGRLTSSARKMSRGVTCGRHADLIACRSARPVGRGASGSRVEAGVSRPT